MSPHHWSNATKITSILDRSKRVFSKYICLCNCLFIGHVMSPHHSDQMYQRSQVFWIALWRPLSLSLSGHVSSSLWSNVSNITNLLYGSVFQNGVGVIQSVTKPLSEGQLKDLLIITVLPAERMITAGWVPVDAVWCAIEPRTKGEKYLVDMLKKITSSSANNRQVVV